MFKIIDWFLMNWQQILLIVNTAVLLLTYIVKLTKTQTDDNWLAGVVAFLKKLSLYKEG